MKIKSLLLGSMAAAGFSASAYAADPAALAVLTSLDVCDALGISGLTISSSTNCLQITGGVQYRFDWGDWRGGQLGIPDSAYAGDDLTFDAADEGPDGNLDWESRVDAWLQFVGTADSSFGPARAVVRIESIERRRVRNETNYGGLDDDGDEIWADYFHGDDTDGFVIDEAYVAVGDQTVIMAGRKGTIANFGDDEPLNFLGLFNSSEVDTGVGINPDYAREIVDGGHVIQVVSDLGNGIAVAAGLENLESDGYDDPSRDNRNAGTAVGVISYAGDGITAHITGLAGGILDGQVEDFAVHAGATVTLDLITLRGAGAFRNDGWWNVLGSARASLDLFTIAVSAEATSGVPGDDEPEIGFGGSVGFAVTDGVSINLGSRYFDSNTNSDNTEGYQAEAQIVAAVTETVTLTGGLGVFGSNADDPNWSSTFYGYGEVGWAPGGGFTTSLRGIAYEDGAYRVTFRAGKAFE